jgi:hypothetical protein
MKTLFGAFGALLLTAAILITPARGQFADQATLITAAGGSANAQTGTVAALSGTYAQLTGVLLKFVPAASNTGDTTLQINGFGTSPHIKKPNGAGLATLVGTEIVTAQPVLLMYDGTEFVLMGPVTLPIAAANLGTSALSFSQPPNLQLNALVSANALTIAIKGSNGSDPSPSNPVPIIFRDATIANGDPVLVSLQAALSFTIASGSSLGCVNAKPCRQWIGAINNGGTVALCAYNALSGTNVIGINEGVLQTSQSGTSGGSSAQLLYCSTSAVTSKAFRILGYIEITEATAGLYATGPTFVQLFGPGIKKAGDPMSGPISASGTGATITGGTPGPAVPSINITPTSAANVVHVEAKGMVLSTGSSNAPSVQVYRSNTGSAACTVAVGNLQTQSPVLATVTDVGGTDAPYTNTQITYVVCTGGSGSATQIYCPQTNGGNWVAPTCTIEVYEVMGLLTEPANDNGLKLKMVG